MILCQCDDSMNVCKSVKFSSAFAYDMRISCRYKNVYCAICNDVTDIWFWIMDMGLIRVEGECAVILSRRNVTGREVYALRMDPSLQVLKNYR